ncbi:M23 family metallopeptidase [Tessaracoccus coleopterorum]|uniref:M23 family metallopeptidase n=1 Tax=Tessaracoccus coleopterorum TaxID=2714950 RepID=UPI0018D426CB|nr:M23 family metallopeptidase [Tessaracoccus coleopterorum]
MAYLSARRVRLVPQGTGPRVAPAIGAARVSIGRLPVDGVRTSPFGMRRHPITGVWKLHDGTDLAAPCGTPVVTPTGGRVTRAYFSTAYGWRVFVEHDGGWSPPTTTFSARRCRSAGSLRPGAGRTGRVDRPVDRLPPALDGVARLPPDRPVDAGMSRQARGWA